MPVDWDENRGLRRHGRSSPSSVQRWSFLVVVADWAVSTPTLGAHWELAAPRTSKVCWVSGTPAVAGVFTEVGSAAPRARADQRPGSEQVAQQQYVRTLAVLADEKIASDWSSPAGAQLAPAPQPEPWP